MAMRKKPIRLETSGEILKSTSPDAIEVRVKVPESKAQRESEQEKKLSPTQLTGGVRLHREVKGRAGKPVSVLSDFTDPSAKRPENLRLLQTQLKESLACGGTFDPESGQIILQVDDLSRVRQLLEQRGFKVKG